MKVAIVGATGQTGSSIVDGLLKSSTKFDITALVRPSSLETPATGKLGERGVKIAPADLSGSKDSLVEVLRGTDVVISAIHYQALHAEIPLANAAKAAGVRRYVPCFFATIAPRGVMALRDAKENILDHINRIYLPYTVIDVGWWYQIGLPKVPSGRFDGGLIFPSNAIVSDGDAPSALTDVRDIGVYVAEIISDPRTLNKKVFTGTETKTQKEVFELVEKLSGETLQRNTISASDIESRVAEARKTEDLTQERAISEYMNSWGVRGDNTPEHAKYFGYLLASELYPGLQLRALEDFIKEMLDGK